MAPVRVAINGFGRIGRMAARIILERDDLELVAINDPSPNELTVHLFKYDSTYGTFPGKVLVEKNGEYVQFGRDRVRNFSSREIADLTWGDLRIDVVLECTGVFRTIEACQAHIDQGAKKVLLSAPPKSDGFTTVVLGVNDEIIAPEDQFISNASCTTNCLAPVAKVLDEAFGIEHGLMTTIHSYTNDQRILDTGHRDFRRARAAGLNLIPTTTGAAKAVGKVLPQLDGKLNGMSIRVPTPTVSLVDLVVKLKTPATVETVNKALQAWSEKHPTILGYEEGPLVSSDYKGDMRSSIVDAPSTMAVGDDMIKVLSWYDNEWGYSNRLVELARKIFE